MKRARQVLAGLWGVALFGRLLAVWADPSRATVQPAVEAGLIALLFLELSWRDK